MSDIPTRLSQTVHFERMHGDKIQKQGAFNRSEMYLFDFGSSRRVDNVYPGRSES